MRKTYHSYEEDKAYKAGKRNESYGRRNYDQ